VPHQPLDQPRNKNTGQSTSGITTTSPQNFVAFLKFVPKPGSLSQTTGDLQICLINIFGLGKPSVDGLCRSTIEVLN